MFNLIIKLRKLRLGLGLVLGMIGIFPLSAAPVSVVIGGITYTADDANVAAGATVFDYDGISQGTDVTILSSVLIAANSYIVNTIGDYAFASNGLTSVVIPSSVTTIGDSAFHTNSLTSFDIPDSVTVIGDNAFESNGLISVGISSGITSIGNATFANNNLTSVVIPDGVTAIGGAAFSYNNLTSVSISVNVTSIGVSAFSYNNLTSVTIPEGVTVLESYAFLGNNLTSVDIADSVTTIETAVFALNDLTSVVIPANVTDIGDFAFADNPALAEVWFEGDAPTILVAGFDGSFGEATGKILYYNCEASGFSTPIWQDYSTMSFCKATFDSQGGSAVATENVITGNTVTEPTAPTYSDHTFVGWYMDAAGTTAYDFSTVISGNITLYAKWRGSAPITAVKNIPSTSSWALLVLLGVLLSGCLLLFKSQRANK